MKHSIFLLITLFFLSCQNQTESETTCDLIDIGAIGFLCDSLHNTGEHAKAARLYFETGTQNQSSELFVYSAWQYSEAGNVDSVLLAVKKAVEYGMNSPYILDKVGMEEASKNSKYRKEVDQLLKDIEIKNASIDNFEIVTSPISRFWTYFAQAVEDTLNAKKYLSTFICEGSDALKDYYHIRYQNVENMNRVMVRKNKDYFTYLKNHFTAEKLNEVAVESQEMMYRFAEMYPKAIFPKTYIVPDLINGSGTLTELGLFIGADMFAKSDSMPLENLNSWQIATITEYENMKFDLVHELMHFQQSYSDDENRFLLIGKIIEEGSCDFLVSILTEDKQPSPGVQRNLDYLADPKNYEFVMSELKRDLYSGNLFKWMHNGGGIKDRPSNLGYTVGFLICKSYYENSKDKAQAIVDLLTTDNFKKIVAESEFSEVL
ncbi:MAG: hypothetical protein AAFO07_02945 [Bacteroidota bacterium]